MLPYRHLLTILQKLKGRLYFSELIIYGVIPQSISIFFIKFVYLIVSFMHLNAKLMGMPTITDS